MPKQSGKKDRVEKAQRRLAKAQIELHAAQEKRAQAITRGEHEIEEARQRAAAWVARATERVEKRAGAVARAEARLAAVTSPRRPDPLPLIMPGTRTEVPRAEIIDPATAATLVERREEEAGRREEPSSLIVPESVEIQTSDSAGTNESPDENSLHPW
jgi:hypothetical protein